MNIWAVVIIAEFWIVEAAGQSFIYRGFVIIAMEASENNDQAKRQSWQMGRGTGALTGNTLDDLAEEKQGGSQQLPGTDISKQKSQQEVIMEGHLSALPSPTKQPRQEPQPQTPNLFANPAPTPCSAQLKSPIDIEESQNKKSRQLSQMNEEVKRDNTLVANRQQRQKKQQALIRLKDFEVKLRDCGSDLEHNRSRKKHRGEEEFTRAQLNRIFKKPESSPIEITYPEMSLRVDMDQLSFAHFAEKFGFFDIVVIDEQVSAVFDLHPQKLIKDGLLFVWAERHEIHLGYYLMGRWGFDVIDQIVWVRTHAEEDRLAVSDNGAMTYSTNCMCLVGFKNTSGKCFEYKTKVSNNLLFSDKDGGRPGQIYEIAQLMMPGSKKIDLYNKRKLKGWVCLEHLPQQPKPLAQEVGKKIYFQQFDFKCEMCGILRIHHCCFECQTCRIYLCQSCMFNLDKSKLQQAQKDEKPEASKKSQKYPKSWHPPTHQWHIKTTNKSNYQKDSICLFCTNKLKLLEKNYVCENCINVYVCQECHGKDLDKKGHHAHRKDHKLALLV